MFGRRKHPGRRHTNILFVTFRLMLSLVIFAVLLGGVYSAYKHFSGLDPLKLDPKSVLVHLLEGKVPDEALTILSSFKIGQISDQMNQKVLGRNDKGQQNLETLTTSNSITNSKVVFKFLLVADSHSDNISLNKAITQGKQTYPDIQFIIGLGDYTEVGTLDEMRGAKHQFDASNLRYFLVPGDHDLWDSRDKNLSPLNNFRQVFGPSYQSFITNSFKFLLLYNSDNYLGISQEQLEWLDGELERAKEEEIKGIFVFVHEPLYHPSSDHFMGRVEKELKNQARDLGRILSKSAVKKVFAGDTHFFSQYEEPETHLSMVTIGAVTTERNPQAPRFAVVTVFEDGSTEVEDVEIK